MGLGRRKASLGDPAAWVFNRMADVYDARPAYPEPLVHALVARVTAGASIVDIGAGIGHLSVPLARLGLSVHAVEPALAMLERLRVRAAGLSLQAHHATAEALPLPAHSVDLALIADALHFLDAERTGNEIQRVLAPRGTLAIVTAELADTPFMQALVTIMREAAPRRPRAVASAHRQVAALAGVTFEAVQVFQDETPLDADGLERVLRSISFVGPAMNAERFAAFRARVLALPYDRVWARTLHLHCGQKRG